MTNDRLKRLREWAQEQRDAAHEDYKNCPGSVERGVLNAERIAYERVMGMADRLMAEPETPPTDAEVEAAMWRYRDAAISVGANGDGYGRLAEDGDALRALIARKVEAARGDGALLAKHKEEA